MEEIAALLFAGFGRIRADVPRETGGRRKMSYAFRRYGENAGFFLVPDGKARKLGVVALREKFLPEGFSGEKSALKGGGVWISCRCDAGNAAVLRRYLPDCAPSAPEKEEEVVFVSSFGEERDGFPVFLAEKESVPETLCRVTFDAFGLGAKRSFAVGAVVRDAEEAGNALDAGATYLVLRPEYGGPMQEIVREEYEGRVFVPGGVKVEIDAAFFAAHGERLRRVLHAALKTAEAVSARKAAWRLELRDFNSVPAYLVLARELFKRGAAPGETVVRVAEEEKKVCAAIAAHYGQYVKSTV